LSDNDFIRFFDEAFQLPEIAAFGVQGHEPLLPESWGLARRLMQMSSDRGLTTSCVTNGVNLNKYAIELWKVCHNLYVSVDSHDSTIHDKSRGKAGAWKKTIEGIGLLREMFGKDEPGTKKFAEFISVNSILYPNQSTRLRGMPEFLESLGVKRWLISPYISVTKGMYPSKGGYESICKELYELDTLSKTYGIEFILGDELRQLEHADDLYQKLSVSTLDDDKLITRLSPDGSYSIGTEILGISGKRMWDKITSPTEFMKRGHADYVSRK
jgi:hypothetical protein